MRHPSTALANLKSGGAFYLVVSGERFYLAPTGEFAGRVAERLRMRHGSSAIYTLGDAVARFTSLLDTFGERLIEVQAHYEDCYLEVSDVAF